MSYSHSSAVSAYRAAAGQAHPMVAVVRLFDEVLRRIRLAIRDTEDKKIEDAYIHISRASLILRGLAGNLRFEQDADLAKTLQDAYIQNMIALHTAFGKPDMAERYAAIMAGLTELRNSWAEIAGFAPVQPPAAPAVEPMPMAKVAAR